MANTVAIGEPFTVPMPRLEVWTTTASRKTDVKTICAARKETGPIDSVSYHISSGSTSNRLSVYLIAVYSQYGAYIAQSHKMQE